MTENVQITLIICLSAVLGIWGMYLIAILLDK